jgi:hypothetical protein
MARIQFGSVITDSRGKLNGHQIRGTRWGQILQLKGMPTNRQTERQQQQRAAAANIAQTWIDGLTQAERDEWTALAATQLIVDRWGYSTPMTGSLLFLRLNARRLAASLSMLITAPADQVVTAPLTAVATFTAGPTIEIAYTTAPAPTNHRVRVYATEPQSPGVTNVDGRYRLLLVTAASPSSPIDVTAAYVDRFGTPPAGRRLHFKISFWKSTNSAESPALTTTCDTI